MLAACFDMAAGSPAHRSTPRFLDCYGPADATAADDMKPGCQDSRNAVYSCRDRRCVLSIRPCKTWLVPWLRHDFVVWESFRVGGVRVTAVLHTRIVRVAVAVFATGAMHAAESCGSVASPSEVIVRSRHRSVQIRGVESSN